MANGAVPLKVIISMTVVDEGREPVYRGLFV